MQLLQLDGGGGDGGDLAEVGEHRAAPQPVGLPEQGGRDHRVLFGVRPPAGEQRAGAGHVQVRGTQCQPVAAVEGLQPRRRRAQVPAEPGHVAVQGLAARLGNLGRPQRVQQMIDRHPAARGERQQREHRPPLRPAHLDRRARHDEPQRPEDLHLQRRCSSSGRVVGVVHTTPPAVSMPAVASTPRAASTL